MCCFQFLQFQFRYFMMLLKQKFWLVSVVFLLCVAIGISIFNKPREHHSLITTELNDGPYIKLLDAKITAAWFCGNEHFEKQIATIVLPIVLSNCNYDVVIDRLNFTEQKVLEFAGDFDVVASSDFHGQYDILIELLRNNGIIDKDNHWQFKNGHFVITGDVFDRGDKVTEILWFLYHLEQEAMQAGGKVHLLLGNHEVMVLNGDLRYLHPKYVAVADKANVSFEQLYAKGTLLGDWLRTKPVLVKVNNMLFTHGGFHPDLAKEKRSLKEINRVFKDNLVKSELPLPRTDFAEYLHKRNGPIWYRGYFKDNGASSEEINLLLRHFDVEHLVVGHTSQKQIETRHQGRVIAIDSSIKRGESGELLFISQTEKWRGTLFGQKKPLFISNAL